MYLEFFSIFSFEPFVKKIKKAPMNGIKHKDAHSAISDVLATVEIAKLLNKTAPNVWKASLMTTNKDKTLQLIKNVARRPS